MRKTKKLIRAVAVIALLSCSLFFAACGETDGYAPVGENYVTKIEITKPADKLEYNIGEKFQTKGMIVTATYADGSKKAVNDYTATRTSKALSVSDKSVTISYAGYSLVQPIFVEDPNADPATVMMAQFTGTFILRLNIYKDQHFEVVLEGYSARTKGVWSWENRKLTLRHYTDGIINAEYSGKVETIEPDNSDTMTYVYHDGPIGYQTVTCAKDGFTGWGRKLGDNTFPMPSVA